MTALWTLAVALLGDSYYVSPSGNDGADGRSPERAWKIVSKVNGAPGTPRGDRPDLGAFERP